MEPKSTRTPAVPLVALAPRVKGEEEDAEAEDPGEDGADHDVVAPRPLAKQAHASRDATVAAKRPRRTSIPAAAAAKAPVKATWLSASPAKT